jgi:hypothetical protein
MYRSVALVDRSEYPTLVYEMDQLISMNGLDGVAFIALNHPCSRWVTSARNCTGGQSVARARTVRDPPTVTPQCHLGFLFRADSKPLSHVNQTKERAS